MTTNMKRSRDFYIKDRKLSGDKKALIEEIRSLRVNGSSKKQKMLGDILREKIIESFSLHLTLCINGDKPKNSHPVRAKSNDLLSSPDDIKDR